MGPPQVTNIGGAAPLPDSRVRVLGAATGAKLERWLRDLSGLLIATTILDGIYIDHHGRGAARKPSSPSAASSSA